ncbi:sensor histidine kinase [Mesorhizobium sp. CAU 1732]|uniref:GAF domain-containing sensor histidine kinase n=1 Tax=Mesorhizobium sp. CAU 1732 TaxID=3140358 RepID=UPI003261039C
MSGPRPAARLNQFFRMSRLLAGQLDFLSAIRSVADEIADVVAHDHLDVCIIRPDGKVHTAYETGIDTAWGSQPNCPVAFSPIRALLMGEVDHMISADATSDPQFHFAGAFVKPIHDHQLRSRIHLPMVVHGEVIGALSFSLHEAGQYGAADIRNGGYVAELLSPYFFALRAAEQARQSAIVEAAARAREEGLRQGALRLTEALETERQRLGMDLHDQTLADLTRLARRLERLSRTQAADPSELAAACEALQASMAALRSIIDEAKPTVLHLFGFAQAVENHLERAIRDSGQAIEADLVVDGASAIDAMPASVSVALLRIVQEAVNNAVSHAAAGRLEVRLGMVGGQVVITVTDDGRGLTQVHRPGGAGIDNMRTRARLIGARLSLGSGREGKGTVMRVALPLAEMHPNVRNAS